MFEQRHAGYRSREHKVVERVAQLDHNAMERTIRLILAICFMGVLGLEFWLLVSALGSG